VLGFILGPIIESNLWPAVQIWGVLGILSRPVTLVLAIFGITSALYLTWMMGSVSEIGKTSPAADAMSANGSTKTESMRWLRRPFKLAWHNEILFSLTLLFVSVWALRETQNFAAVQSRFLPMWLLTFMIPLQVVQIARLSLGFGARGQVMDLGMRTGTDAEATRRLGVVAIWVIAYIVAVALIGMPWASIGFALVFGVFNSSGAGLQRLWAIVPALLMALIIFGMFEQGMYVEWPTQIALPRLWAD
jgi:hypothetical protein